MPNRILKESTLTSPNLNSCSIEAQDLYKRILCLVDDYGCSEANISILYGKLYLMCLDSMNIGRLERLRQELIDNDLIKIWIDGQREYLHLNGVKHLLSLTDEGKHTRHRRKTPEPPQYIVEESQKESNGANSSQASPSVAKSSQEGPNHNPNPNLNHNPLKDYAPTEDALRLSHLLKKLILENNPKAIIKEKSFNDWIRVADIMLKEDKRPYEEMVVLLEWCQADSFWHKNVLSMYAFREKYDRLTLESKPKNVDPRLKNKVITKKYHVEGDPESPPLEVKEPVEQPKVDAEKRSKCQF